MILISLFLSYLGFFLLCLAMERHYQQVFNRRPSKRQEIIFTVLGWVALALSLPPAIIALDWSIGISAWVGLLTVSASTLVLMLPYAPRGALVLGIASTALAIIPAVVIPVL